VNPLPHQVRAALAQLRSGASNPAALSRAIAAEVAQRLRQSAELVRSPIDRRTAIETLYPLATSWCREYIRAVVADLGQAQSGPDLGQSQSSAPLEPTLGDALADATYLERLSHLAIEDVLVNPAAPPLQISPVGDRRHVERLLTSSPTVAVIFDYPLAITHELYPLWTDAFVFGQSAPDGEPSLEVIGVHASWLDADCRARRAITYLPDEDLFVEAPCHHPHVFGAALLLAQSSSCHRALAHRLREARIPHANDWDTAAVADDKWECYLRWRRAGVRTPPTCLLERDLGATDASDRIRRFTGSRAADVKALPGGWVIQPRHGTESRGVRWVSGDTGIGDLLTAWEEISPTDDAILRDAVGRVCLSPAEGEDGPRCFDLRLHVSGEGRCYTCESGYLMVAPAGSPISTSPSSGGSILSWTRLLAQDLIAGGERTDAPDRLAMGSAELECARRAATAAAGAVGSLALCGIDLKFDWYQGSLVPTILDLNPRPAGLLHSDLLVTDGSQPEAGIARGLWRRLRRLATG
jgi:hypothetical protein